MRSLLLIAGLSAFFSKACAKTPEPPVDAYLAMVDAARKGDGRLAFRALSAASQAQLTERAELLSKLSGGAIQVEPGALFFDPEQSAPPITEIKLVSIADGTADLDAVTGNTPARVRMVEEQGSWKVDLAPSLFQNK